MMSGADIPDDPAHAYDQWSQCCAFRPANSALIPDYLAFQPESEWLIICTQTCSICGAAAQAEPRIEVIVGTPLMTFDPKDLAALGRKVGKLHLQFEGGTEFEGLSLDMSRRAFLPREILGTAAMADVTIKIATLAAFQGWISRYYSRIAMPDALVKRIRKDNRGGIQKCVSKALAAYLMRQATMERYVVHSDVSRFYIDWLPDAELPGDKDYVLRLLVVCTSRQTQEYLDVALECLASGIGAKAVANGIVMDAPEVKVDDDVTLADLRNMKRFSEWDELSSHSEILGVLRS